MEPAARPPRTHPRARLLVAALLFAGWLGFLGYLVWRSRDLVVVSRPQLLVADLVVTAEVADEAGAPRAGVHVREVHWPRDPKSRALAGQTIDVADLPDIGAGGYRGPGDYVLVLGRTGDSKVFQITPLPAVPGFAPAQALELVDPGEQRDEVAALLAQLRQIDIDRARTLIGDRPRLIARNLPWRDALDWRERFTQAGAIVQHHPLETRIYAATPDVLAQLAEALPQP